MEFNSISFEKEWANSQVKEFMELNFIPQATKQQEGIWSMEFTIPIPPDCGEPNAPLSVKMWRHGLTKTTQSYMNPFKYTYRKNIIYCIVKTYCVFYKLLQQLLIYVCLLINIMIYKS